MEETKLKISVALCTYNGEKFLQEQLDSIVNQTMKVDQIVLSDDNSLDNTIEILEQFKNEHGTEIDIEIIRNIPGLGVVKNFEKAISMCNGDIIFTSDQDDVWPEEKVRVYYDVFLKNKNAKLVYSDAFIVDVNLQHYKETMWENIKHKPIYKGGASETIPLKINYITGATMAFKSDIKSYIIPFPLNNMFHDHWILLSVHIIHGITSIYAIEKPLLMYRQHGNNVLGCNNSTKKSKLSIVDYVDSRYYNSKLIINLFQNYKNCKEKNIRSFVKEQRFIRSLYDAFMNKKVFVDYRYIIKNLDVFNISNYKYILALIIYKYYYKN